MLHSQYHGCSWPGHARSQGISNHYIYYVGPDQFGPRTLRVKTILFQICFWYYDIPALILQLWGEIDNFKNSYQNYINEICPKPGSNIFVSQWFANVIQPIYNWESIFQPQLLVKFLHMMTSSNGNISRVTGHLCGEFNGPRWISHTKASDAELWCFLWSASE